VGEEIEVRFYDGLNGTPAAALAVAGWAHGEQSGFGDGNLSIHASQKAFVAFLPDGHEQAPVGVATFDLNGSEIWIYQAFVVEHHRGEGIWTVLLDHLIAKAIELKIPKIRLGVHLKNKHAREAYRKTGFVEEAVTCTLEVPQL